MSNPDYYVKKDNPYTDLTLVSAVTAGLTEWLIEAQTGGGTYNKILRVSGITLAGEIVVGSIDIVVNSSNNTVSVAGSVISLASTTLVEAVVHEIIDKGVVALGVQSAGKLLSIAATVGVDILYSVFVEDNVNQIVNNLEGVTAVDIQIRQSLLANTHIAGAFYSSGISTNEQLRSAIKDILAHGGSQDFPAINVSDMRIQVNGAVGNGDIYFLYDGQIAQKLANFFHGGDLQEFLSVSNNVNRSFYAEVTGGAIIFAREGDDVDNLRVYVNETIGGEYTAYRGFNPANIYFAADHSGIINASSGRDLIVGSSSNDSNLNGGAEEDFIYGGKGSDKLSGGQGNDFLYGGTGIDTVDHSFDPNVAPIVITLDYSGNGTAVDGWGNTDTLYSIEGFIGSNYNDTVNLDGVLGGVFDGGLGVNGASYFNQTDAIDNVNGIVYKNTLYDSFVNFDSISANASTVLVDTKRADGHLGGLTKVRNTLEGAITKSAFLDYSLSDEKVNFNINFYDDRYGNTYSRDITMTADIGSVSQYARLMDASTLLLMSSPYSIVSDTQLRGSHKGDIVYYHDLSETGYNSFTFFSGRGDDRFELSTIVGTNGINYGYSGGDDVIIRASLISYIIMGEGIKPEDVSISSNIITIAGRGTITLEDEDFPINAVVTYGGLKGTWSDDIFTGAIGSITYDGYAGNDVIYGGTGVSELYGGLGSDHLHATAGENILYGGPGDDSFYIGDVLGTLIYDDDGVNILNLTAVSVDNFDYRFDDVLFTLSFFNSIDDIVTVHDYWTFDSVYFSDNSSISVSSLVSNGVGFYGVSHKADFINASGALSSVNIDLLSGNDTYYGSAYGDTVHGGAGDDTIIGDWGDDILYGDSGNDYLDGWDGYNILYGGSGDDELYANTGMADLYGGLGDDRYYISSGAYSFISDYVGLNTLYVLDIDSTQYSYVIDSENGFYLYDDYMNEFLFMDDYRNFSTITFSDEVVINFSSLSGEPGGNSQGFVATEGNDIIYAANAEGAVTLDLLDGDDVYDASFYGDSIRGGNGSDMLYGWSGNDRLWGDAGDDYLYGFAGDDILNGGKGDDALYGGSGADIFEFTNDTFVSGIDYIGDFSLLEGDSLDLSDLVSFYDPITDAITDFIQIVESGGDSLLYVDRDGVGSSHGLLLIAELGSVSGLTDIEAMITNGNIQIA